MRKYLGKFLITKVNIKHYNNNFQFGWFWKALIIIDHILVVGNRPTWPQYKKTFDSLKSKYFYYEKDICKRLFYIPPKQKVWPTI